MPTVNVAAGSGPQLQEIADILAKSRKVVVITGAGISTNSGIPDFRSENGLYALIQAQYDAAAARDRASTNTPDIDDRPTKRIRLTRSCSSSSKIANVAEPDLNRRLRSSRSSIASSSASVLEEALPAHKRRALEGSAHAPFQVPQIRRRHSSAITATASSSSSDTEDLFSCSQSSASSRTSLPNLKGKDLFDSIIWTDALTTSIFYTFITSLRATILNDVKSTTETHRFIKALRDCGRLVRNYTQNIDMLEAREGLCTELQRGTGDRSRFSQKAQPKPEPTDESSAGSRGGGVEVVHLHGSLDALRCELCAKLSSWDEDDRHATTLAGEAPECPWCTANSAHREGRGRRSLAIGRLRPNIVLYGEEHPNAHLVAPLITHDLSLGPDVMLILGTSLRVHGLKVMVREFAKAVHGKKGKVVFVNQTKPPESIWGDIIDYWVEWDCDAWVMDLKERREDIWLPRRTLDESTSKEEKVRPPAKNPAATRPDMANGAYLTHKIMKRLGQLSGRVPEHEEKPQKEAKARKRKSTEMDEGENKGQHSTELPSLNNLKIIQVSPETSTSEKKHKSQPRPNAVRDNKDNGAHVVTQIMGHLRRLSGDASDALISPIMSRKRKQKSHDPLTTISPNIPRNRVSKKSSLDKSTISNHPQQQSQLPTPPNSDQATPEPPMTPGTQRIKQLGSIAAILSSPLSERRVNIWRDGPPD